MKTMWQSPPLLAVSAVHKHLVKRKMHSAFPHPGIRGTQRSTRFCSPFRLWGLCGQSLSGSIPPSRNWWKRVLNKDYYAAVEDYDRAILQGIVKLPPKWDFHHPVLPGEARFFEAIGISSEVIDRYFTQTVSRVGGITLQDIAAQTDEQHSKAFDPLGLDTDLTLSSMGRHKNAEPGEEHRYNPRTIHLLQQSTKRGQL